MSPKASKKKNVVDDGKSKYQSTMDSFFSAGGKGASSNKSKMKQSKINFGGGNSKTTKKVDETSKSKSSKKEESTEKEEKKQPKLASTEKENVDNDAKEEEKQEEETNDNNNNDTTTNDFLEDTDDEDDNNNSSKTKKKKIKSKKQKSSPSSKEKDSNNKKRRIIQDEDDNDDDDEQDKKADDKEEEDDDDDDKTVEMETENNPKNDGDDDDDFEPDKEEEEKGDDDDEEMEDVVEEEAEEEEEMEDEKMKKSPTKKKKKETTSKTTKKKSVNDVLKHKKTTAKKTSSTTKKSEVFASGMKSDENLLTSDKDMIWEKGTCIPYKVLCNVFEKIEEVSGRLQIQEILTELFRRTILLSISANNNDNANDEDDKKKSSSTKDSKSSKNKKSKDDPNKDMYDLIYLASNSVAPSYECVELGIGDSILIKAIGEAYGTNPSMIKQKYEQEGDLGLVACQQKGKQRTLNFGIKPKPLLATNVISCFRTIAQTTGNSSQKWKIQQIKGLLVRAQGNEAKYIIRGLQGKLRIGLARTTVLISLAHAITLTKPPTVIEAGKEMVDIENTCTDIDNTYPNEAKEYINTSDGPLDKHLDAAVSIIKKAYSEVPSYDALLDAALSVPLEKMHKSCTLTPGIPVEPMLAKPTKSIQEVLKRLNGQRFTCEYKYDGERAQVHMTPEGKTSVFSRNLLDTSEKFPEIPLYVKEAADASTTASNNEEKKKKTDGGDNDGKKQKDEKSNDSDEKKKKKKNGDNDNNDDNDKVTSFVLDTEVVAFNRETNQLVPFQVLSTRKKKEDGSAAEDGGAKVQVIVQAFDLMYINGKSLLNLSLSERRTLLYKYFTPVEGKFQFAKSLDHKEDGDTTVLEEFLETAVKNQCEGLMVKTLDDNAAYEPSKRSLNWLKLKKDYLEGLGDSVDLVPLGAYHGRGKRTGVYGAYLLACRDEETEEYQSVCKIGTGFSDDDLKSLYETMKGHIIPEKTSQYNVSDTLECDVWFDTVQVWEVKAADLSKSSTHKGALGRVGEANRGIGLRFPRFERIRTDKKPEQATSSEQILEMYYQQDSVQVDDGTNNNGNNGGDMAYDDDEDGI